MGTPIYLDHAATTQLRPEAFDAMHPFLVDNFANPSSVYRQAQHARSAVDHARDVVAQSLGAESRDIIFTGGGTESDNAAIKGVALAARDRGRHIVTSAIEHHAVLHPVQELVERFGFDATIVPVDRDGIVQFEALRDALRPDTVLVSVMWANNEIGTIQPIGAIAELTRNRGIPLHVDAVQAAGSVSIDLDAIPIDLLSISAHKFYGPKGVGVLFVRSGTPWWPLLTGGGQERNRRSGTENVAGIVGLATALALSVEERAETNVRVGSLRDELLHGMLGRISGVTVNGHLVHRLPSNLNINIEGVHGESLLVALDLADIMASSGSACTSGSLEPSHVLLALGQQTGLAQSSLRLTLGRETSRDDVERTVDVLNSIVQRLRRLSPDPVPA